MLHPRVRRVSEVTRAAVLHDHGEAPRADDFDEPVESDGRVVADVAAAGVNHLDLLKASGRFYTGAPPLPSVVGSDGVGRLADGRRVFFDLGGEADPAGALRSATGDGADVIVDPLWGKPAIAAMGAAKLGARHLQIGHMANPTAELPGLTVRSAMLDLLGFVVFRAPLEVRRHAYRRLTEHAARGEIEVDLERVPLDDVEEAWRRQGQGPDSKLVVVP